MKNLIIYFVLLIGNIGLAQPWEMPQDKAEFLQRIKQCHFVPSADEQIAEYQALYTHAKQQNPSVEWFRSVIPGLGQMLERALGYTYLCMSTQQKDRYRAEFDNFTKEAWQVIGNITIRDLSLHCLRASTLLSDELSFPNARDVKIIMSIGRLISDIDRLESKGIEWRELDFYRALIFNQRRWAIADAILFCDELTQEQFVAALLADKDLPLTLAMYPAAVPEQSPHGGLFRTPIALLYHDYLHNAVVNKEFAAPDSLEFFHTIFRHRLCCPDDIKLLFLITHELPMKCDGMDVSQLFREFIRELPNLLENPYEKKYMPADLQVVNQHLNFDADMVTTYFFDDMFAVKYSSCCSANRVFIYRVECQGRRVTDFCDYITGITFMTSVDGSEYTFPVPEEENYTLMSAANKMIQRIYTKKYVVSNVLKSRIKADGYDLLESLLGTNVAKHIIFSTSFWQRHLCRYQHRWQQIVDEMFDYSEDFAALFVEQE